METTLEVISEEVEAASVEEKEAADHPMRIVSPVNTKETSKRLNEEVTSLPVLQTINS